MFVNEKVCEIVLIISGSTDNELFADNVIELSKSSREVFTIIMGYFCIYNCERMVKDWWWMVFTPDR